MRVVLQVVNNASVAIDGQVYNQINDGFLLFVGIGKSDGEENVKAMAEKISKLRVFADENGKTNLDIHAIKGEILSISQFTLYGNLKGSNRPDFFDAADKETAFHLYNLFNKELEKHDVIVKSGVFGADMKVCLTNDGPFTIFVEN